MFLPLSMNTSLILSLKVLISFLVPAYLTLIAVVMHYLFDFRSSHDVSTNALDRLLIEYVWHQLMKYVWKGRLPPEKWGEAMRACVLSFSDIQLVTGIAILSAGFSQLQCSITSYHWQIIVYLAWFSSFTHMATLSLLREYFRRKPMLRWLRIIAMFVMLSLLIAALIPTGNAAWLINGIPAKRFYVNKKYPLHSEQTSTMVISIFFLLISYVTRTIKFFESSSTWMTYWFGERPAEVLKRRMDVLFLHQRRWTRIQYVFILVTFILFQAVYDVYSSMLWEVCSDSL